MSADPKQSRQQPAVQPPAGNDKTDIVKATQGDALTPDQKHQNYLDLIEKLHNEP